jgi:hypothetical protein
MYSFDIVLMIVFVPDFVLVMTQMYLVGNADDRLTAQSLHVAVLIRNQSILSTGP